VAKLDVPNGYFERLVSIHLNRALAEERLELHYQPQVNLATGQLVGLEALARWQHSALGAVAPKVFVDVAEKTGLMPRFTRWVLHRACRQNVLWQAHGHRPLKVAVNVSPSNFADQGFVDDVAEILRQTGLEPRWLELELTECAIFQNRTAAAESMRRLSDMGISLALDDFGSGYASMSHFKYFPINRLKLDRSFLCDLPDSRCAKGKKIVEAILMFARHMGIEAVAEGIETEAQRNLLEDIGCPIGQGYLLGTPMSANELTARSRPSASGTYRRKHPVATPLTA